MTGWVRACAVGMLLLVLGVVGLRLPAMSLQSMPLGTGFGAGRTVTMLFERVDRITPGTEIRYGQRLVGRVASVAADGSNAVVTGALSPDEQVPRAVFAQVRLPTALGTPMVAFVAPARDDGQVLADGDVIDRAHTGMGPGLESTLAALGVLLNGSGIDQFRTVMRELSTAGSGRGGELSDLRVHSERALELYAQHREDLQRTIRAVDEASAALTAERQLVDRGMALAAPVVAEVAGQRDLLASLVDQSALLATTASRLSAGTEGQVAPQAQALSAVAAELRSFNDRVSPTLSVVQAFVDRFGASIRGDSMVFDGHLDLPGSADKLGTGGAGRATQGAAPAIPVLPGGYGSAAGAP